MLLQHTQRLATLATLTLALLFAPGCAEDADGLDENGKPTLDGTGYQELDDEKADGLSGRRGPNTSFDNGAAQVWQVSWAWNDTAGSAPLKRRAGQYLHSHHALWTFF